MPANFTVGLSYCQTRHIAEKSDPRIQETGLALCPQPTLLECEARPLIIGRAARESNTRLLSEWVATGRRN